MSKRDEDILQQAGKRFREAWDADKDERAMIDEDVRFAINDEDCQWPQEILDKRRNQSPARPCLTINKIPEKIDQIEGEFFQLAPTAKIRAGDQNSDPRMADIYGGKLRSVEYESDARSVYNHAFTSVLYGGRGAWRYDVRETDDDPFIKKIEINSIPNVMSVVMDPMAKKANYSDAQYCFVVERISRDEYKAKYGEEINEWPTQGYWEDWRDEDSLRVAEYWWKEKTEKTFYRVERNNNGIPNIETVTKLMDGEIPIETKKAKVPVVKWCKLVAGKLLTDVNEWSGRNFPIVLMLGKKVNVRGKTKSRGMVRFAKTPQRMYNYWASAQTEMVALAPKVPYLVTGSMIGPYEDLWRRSADENFPYLLYDIDQASPTAAPRREPPPMLSTAYAAEMSRQEHDIMSAMGIYQASLGERSNEKSGKAIQARQSQGNIGSYAFLDAFRAAYLHGTNIFIELMPTVYDTERFENVIEEDGTHQTIPMNARPQMPEMPTNVPPNLLVPPKEGRTPYANDVRVGKFSAVVTLGPTYGTLRQESVAQLLDLLSSIPQVGPGILDLIVENMDIPQGQKLVKRLKKMVPIELRGLDPGEEPPPPPPTDPKLMEMMARLKMDMHEQMRKDFEAQINAIETIARAESLEQGQQLEQYLAQVSKVHEAVTLKQKQEELAQGQQELGLQQQEVEQAAQQPPTGE